MKLLHLLPTIDPAWGGPVEVVRNLSSALLECGVENDVVSLSPALPEWRRGWHVPLHELDRAFFRYRFAPALSSWLKRSATNYRAVLVHGVWQYQSFAAWRALPGKKIPYFLFPHGALSPWFRIGHPLKHAKKTVYWKMIERRTFRDADAVLFTSEAERDGARQSFHPFECSDYVVGMGTAEPPGDPAQQRMEFHAAFPELNEKRVLLFLGRLHTKKGCDLLMHAFGRIAAVDARLHLLMAGPDESKLGHMLRTIAASYGVQDRVTWVDFLSGDRKWGALRSADALVLPSHTENYGNAVVEALACGTPVVISDKVNIWREIASDGAGLVGSDDLDGTTKALKDWVELSPDRRREYSLAARRCFERHFEIGQFADRLAAFLRERTGAREQVECVR